MSQAVWLGNAEERHKLSPHTFPIPPIRVRQNAPIGSYVKIIFNDCERMWVEVIQRVEGPPLVYVGQLRNVPCDVPLNYGDGVRFGPENIVDVRQ